MGRSGPPGSILLLQPVLKIEGPDIFMNKIKYMLQTNYLTKLTNSILLIEEHAQQFQDLKFQFRVLD